MIAFFVLLVLLGCGQNEAAVRPEQVIRVSAASSLTDALREVVQAFETDHPGIQVELNFASSGVLKHQIEQGAPVDVFISASAVEMDALDQKNLTFKETRANIASNELILAARLESKFSQWGDLLKNEVKRIAISNPETVPSGRYAKRTLVKRGLWEDLKDKFVYGENVRQTLGYLSRGDADVAIIFTSDALTERGKVKIVAKAVSGVDHPEILYPAVVVVRSQQPAPSTAFVSFLRSEKGSAVLQRYGFLPPPN